MSESKQAILARIRNQLGKSSSQKTDYNTIPRTYLSESEKERNAIIELFIERVNEYKAVVKRADSSDIREVIARCCKDGNARNIVIPEGLPQKWLPDHINWLEDRPGARLTKQQIDEADATLTGCAVAVAQTGTICLNTREGQGRRILTLVPDFHICIVKERLIVELLPEAIAQLQPDVENDNLPITFISGPSATSDIELSRVEGVHGPRKLTVIVLSETSNNI